jgi:beta-aspartyl-peptidase (threonine type)
MKGMKDIGGLIALDKNGSVEFFYNTKGMYRGFITSENAKAETFIY